MKYLTLLFIIGIWNTGCSDSKETVIRDICSADSPAIVLPDVVVCNHAPANNIEVVGHTVTYMCTKIGDTYED